MLADGKPTIYSVVYPNQNHREVRMTIDIPGPQQEVDSLSARADLVPFAAVLVRYRIEAKRNPDYRRVVLSANDFAIQDDSVFDAAWEFLNNRVRESPRARGAGVLKRLADAIKHMTRKRTQVIEFDRALLPEENIGFKVERADGKYLEFDSRATEPMLVELLEFLLARRTLPQLSRAAEGPSDAGSSEFRFGSVSTMTTVVQRFLEGLPAPAIRSELLATRYSVPPEIDALIDRSHQLLCSDAPGLVAVRDHPMLAPRHAVMSVDDLDEGPAQFHLQLAESSYRFYIAFVTADRLAERDPQLRPLVEFVRLPGASNQPAPATASIGVRVMVETRDRMLVVSHRSSQVKLNPDVWSSSANEGVRLSLVENGGNSSDLFERAVDKALTNELYVKTEERHTPTLVSVYHNRWNQWGAGFYVKVDLTLDEVIARQPGSRHGWEHQRIAGVPVIIDACGRAMRDLGTRWYGGALETICAVLSWRERADSRFVSPDQVGDLLSRAAGGAIVPVDEINPKILPPAGAVE